MTLVFALEMAFLKHTQWTCHFRGVLAAENIDLRVHFLQRFRIFMYRSLFLCNNSDQTWLEPRPDKINNVVVRPAKTQISLGIRPVWSESSLSAWRKFGSLATQWAHSEDSDLRPRDQAIVNAWKTMFDPYIDFQIQEIFPERVANPINKRVRSTSLFIGFASLEGNISFIWKPMWFNQYITFFFIEYFKFISICFEVLRSLWSSISTLNEYTRKDTWKLNLLAAILFWNGQGYLLLTFK